MLKDKILVGSMAGIIATLFKAIPNLILWKLKIVPALYLHIAASSLILPKDVNRPIGIIIGLIADLITGGTIGILAAQGLKIFGCDYLAHKGLVIGSLVWLFGFGVALNLGVAKINPSDPLLQLTSLIDHLIFGLITVYLIIKLSPTAERKI